VVAAEALHAAVASPRQASWRVWLFRLGVVAAMFTLVCLGVFWSDPFPLVHHGNGDLSISPWFNRFFAITSCGAFATILLALFGHGAQRLLLVAGGLLLLFLTYGALLSNGV
jgi:hypothetical protein